jgi:hypothetical protein
MRRNSGIVTGFSIELGMGQFQVVEGDREIKTVGLLSGAAMEWAENPNARRVYRMAPSGLIGTGVWQRDSEVTPGDLMAALPHGWTNSAKNYEKS